MSYLDKYHCSIQDAEKKVNEENNYRKLFDEANQLSDDLDEERKVTKELKHKLETVAGQSTAGKWIGWLLTE